MKRILASSVEAAVQAPEHGDGTASLVRVEESSTEPRAISQPLDSTYCEEIEVVDVDSAAMRRKKPRLAPEEGALSPSSESIPNPSSEEINKDAKAVESEKQLSTMVNLSVIHGPSDVSLSHVPAEDQFPYQPLDTSKLEIRIIALHPGTLADPICCSLIHIATKKGSKAVYAALSYTWGTPKAPKTIILNGEPVQVRENLWQALYHLRSEQQELRIWIDALCINQNDLQERSSQVSRMSAIYGIAKEVVVWLGAAGENSKLAMDFMQQKFVHKQGSQVKDIPLDELLLHTSKAEVEAIAKLMTREYWHRVWIIQEIFRAQFITIRCGHDKMHWSSLSKFFRYLSMYELAESTARRGLKLKYDYLLQACGSPAISLTDHRTSQKHCLEDLLIAYKDCRSSDPRDKVYALVGLAQRKMRSNSDPVTKGDDWIDVDYSKSALDIFRTLVILYQNARTSYSEYEGPDRVKWMQSLQEVLELRDSLDADNTRVLTMTGPLRESSWWRNSGTVSDQILLAPGSSGIPCECYIVSTTALRTDCASSPLWAPLTEDYGDILEWHSSLPGIDHSKRARAYLELLLGYFRDHDLERLKKFGHPTTGTDPSHSVQASIGLKGRYLIMTPCPIIEGCELIAFEGSNIALVVMGMLVVCRALIYNIERKGDRINGTNDVIAYVELPDIVVSPNGRSWNTVPHPNGLPWGRTIITLSIEDWARVVSLGNWPTSK